MSWRRNANETGCLESNTRERIWAHKLNFNNETKYQTNKSWQIFHLPLRNSIIIKQRWKSCSHEWQLPLNAALLTRALNWSHDNIKLHPHLLIDLTFLELRWDGSISNEFTCQEGATSYDWKVATCSWKMRNTKMYREPCNDKRHTANAYNATIVWLNNWNCVIPCRMPSIRSEFSEYIALKRTKMNRCVPLEFGKWWSTFTTHSLCSLLQWT